MSQSILIVEDERMIAGTLAQLVKGYGYDMAGIAHSGADRSRTVGCRPKKRSYPAE